MRDKSETRVSLSDVEQMNTTLIILRWAIVVAIGAAAVKGGMSLESGNTGFLVISDMLVSFIAAGGLLITKKWFTRSQ